MENIKAYSVYGQGLARYLENQGFELKYTTQNSRDKNKTVYIFDESEELLKAVDTYEVSKYSQNQNKPVIANEVKNIIDELKNMEWCFNENTKLILEVLDNINKNLEEIKNK